ncbi:MAG: hypothetical protein V3V00_08905 [Saprospiraceae bacterium]
MLFISLLLFLASCGNPTIGSEGFDMNGSWDFTSPVRAKFSDIQNTDSYMAAAIKLTYSDDFPFENIYLKAVITCKSDTLLNNIKSYDLQNDLGQWIGNNDGRNYTIKLNLMDSIDANTTDIHVKLEQYSREDKLTGIQTVKILIE